jgi:multidrug resistance efflux pump
MKRLSSGNYSFRLRPHLFPIIVWLGALACVAFLFTRRSQRFEVLGMAQGQVNQVASNSPGRLKSVPVQLFDEVKEGQTVAVINAVLDNEQPRSELQAQLATILAEIEHLTAQLVPTQDSLSAENADRQTNRISDRRRFSVDVENARLEILRLRAQIETDRIQLEDLALDVKITQDLIEKQVAVPYELQKIQAQYNTMAKQIAENEHLLEQAEAALKQAIERRDEYIKFQTHQPSVDDALGVIRKEIKVQERRMDELLTQLEALDLLESLELKAPFDGVVSEIQHFQAETVLAGEPILTITQTRPTEIIAYAGEEQANLIREGMTVELVKSIEPAQIARSRVISVGPVVEQMPVRLWRNPNVPQWGRPFLIQVPAQMKLVIGEVIGIRRLK